MTQWRHSFSGYMERFLCHSKKTFSFDKLGLFKKTKLKKKYEKAPFTQHKPLFCLFYKNNNQLSDLEEDISSLYDCILGYFDRRDQPEYQIFRRMATNLKDDCQFHVGFGEASQQMHPPGQPIIVFRPDKDRSTDLDETYPGSLTNFDELHVWAQVNAILKKKFLTVLIEGSCRKNVFL